MIRWSPVRRVLCMEEVGMAITWATKLMAKTRIRMVHVHSAMKPRASGWRLAGGAGSAVLRGLVSVVTGIRFLLQRVAFHQLQAAVPAGLREEVLGEVNEVVQVVSLQILRRGVIGPKDDRRFPDNVFA